MAGTGGAAARLHAPGARKRPTRPRRCPGAQLLHRADEPPGRAGGQRVRRRTAGAAHAPRNTGCGRQLHLRGRAHLHAAAARAVDPDRGAAAGGRAAARRGAAPLRRLVARLGAARDARLGQPLAWLAWPLAYFVFALAHGALSGRYLYPFADVGALGIAVVARNGALLLV